MPVAVLQPGWIAWTRWASAAGVPALPAPPDVYGAFLSAVEAQGGPFARDLVADQVASVAAALGLPDPAGDRPGTWYDVPAGSDWATHPPAFGVPPASTVSGWGYPPAWELHAREAIAARAAPELALALQGFQLAGGLRPDLGRLSPREAESMLLGLVARDLAQYRAGVPPVSLGLRLGRIVYDREDPDERWLSAADLWTLGAGDCEDLAAAVAAERTLAGIPSRVRILRSGPHQLHAVVQEVRSGRLLDPSLTGGMGRPDRG